MIEGMIGIFGTGGLGKIVAWLLKDTTNRADWPKFVFIDDDVSKHGERVLGIEVCGPEALKEGRFAFAIPALGEGHRRQEVERRLHDNGIRIGSAIHSSAIVAPEVAISAGCIISAGSVLQPSVFIGPCVYISSNATVAHDCVVEGYVSFGPGVQVAGNVHIGAFVSIGTGASIINGTPEKKLSIGDRATVGAGACVTRNVPAGATVVGVPAKIVKQRS